MKTTKFVGLLAIALLLLDLYTEAANPVCQRAADICLAVTGLSISIPDSIKNDCARIVEDVNAANIDCQALLGFVENLVEMAG